MTDLQQIERRLNALVILRKLAYDNVINGIGKTIRSVLHDPPQAFADYARLCSDLFEHGTDLSEYIKNTVLDCENPYLASCIAGKPHDPILTVCFERELTFLQTLCGLRSDDLLNKIEGGKDLPKWTNARIDLKADYDLMIQNLGTKGYGIFRAASMLVLRDQKLVPSGHPDNVRPEELIGYEKERGIVTDNTRILAQGRRASNILLYGDSGSGKSTTVKAAANAFFSEGVRLIEVKKRQLHEIPALLNSLSHSPLKFILFIDDLSFTKDDDDYAALKGILEGSVSVRANNAAVYATTNRRHLVRESFSDREGDEVHANDTVQQMTSLSERFGLTITFLRPNKAQFAEIVKKAAPRFGVDPNKPDLLRGAEEYALMKGGRSPRTAVQFLEVLSGDLFYRL